MTPHLRKRRFWEAIRVHNHKVFPLWPGGSDHIPEGGIFDERVDDESIFYLEEREADVAFPTGVINETTVIEVTSALAQEMMDELDVEQGAQIWTPRARYFLFDYIERSELKGECMFHGLRIVGDGEWIHYPGNWMDGYLVHWEHNPRAVGTQPFPREFWDEISRSA